MNESRRITALIASVNDVLPEDAFMALLNDIADLADTDLSTLPRTLRNDLSDALLSISICPIHFCDYAICFDDDNADCSSLRIAFPLHNT